MAILDIGNTEPIEGYDCRPNSFQGILQESACKAYGTIRMVAACALLLALASLSFGCTGKADLPSNNVFDDILACDFIMFAQVANGAYDDRMG